MEIKRSWPSPSASPRFPPGEPPQPMTEALASISDTGACYPVTRVGTETVAAKAWTGTM